MKLSKSVAELQREHVVMELESIDRMYLNAYVPQPTTEAGVAGFVRGYFGHHRGNSKEWSLSAWPRKKRVCPELCARPLAAAARSPGQLQQRQCELLLFLLSG